MSPASPVAGAAETPLFVDGLGGRTIAADETSGELLQILRLRPELTAVPSFEFAIRERTARLVNFRHAYYARVRRVDRLPADGTLAIVSDHVEGTRLSEILRVAHARGLQLDVNAALCLIRQLVPAIALLHENARDAAHGLIAPERLIVTPHGRLVVVEHVAGSAIELLQRGRERLWLEFRVAVPSSAGVPRFDHRADVTGIGITALSLILGRPLAADEFPHGLPGLLMQARERSSLGTDRPLSNAFRNWLARTLQLDVRRAFASAPEALSALEDMLGSDCGYVPAPVALETFLSQYFAAVLQPGPAAPATPPSVVPPCAPTARLPAPPAAERPAGDLCAGGDKPGAREQVQPPVSSACSVTAGAWAPAPEEGPGFQALPTIADLIAVTDLQQGARAAGPGEQRGHVVPPATRGPFPQPDDSPDYDERDVAEGTADRVEDPNTRAARRGPGDRVRLLAALAAGLTVVMGAGLLAARLLSSSGDVQSGTLIVQSSPPGVEVFVDGVSRGMTPAQLSVAAGSHILELRGRGVPRVIPFQVAAGGQVSQYLEFADTLSTGMLVVHSEPEGARVSVDGVPRGTTPLTLEGLEPGDHDVLLQNDTGSSRHVVKVLAGTTASLVAPVVAAPQGPVSGWISVRSPFAVEIREKGRLIGTTETDRLMLAAGSHVLEFVNEPLAYRETRVVQVVAGKVLAFALDLPKGTLNLNASPWAEVWIEGHRVGETPIGNLELTIGAYEIVFRHPQFGEKRQAVSVTTAAPVRLSVAMNQ